MPEENKVNALVNIGQMKLAENAYNDTASPAMKRIGQALSTVLDISNTILWPVKWANEKTRIFFEDNLRKYEEKLKTIPEDKICCVPPEIAIPILERFSRVTNEDLSNAFLKLLAAASSTETISIAHPGFIQIIDRLSSDEAKILNYFKDNNYLPTLSLSWHSKDYTSYRKFVNKETLITNFVGLSFENNIDLYFDNLTSLGLVSHFVGFYDEGNQAYSELLDKWKKNLDDNRPEHVTDQNENKFIKIDKEMILKTQLGDLFIKTCIGY
jgi:hypothetical protein